MDFYAILDQVMTLQRQRQRWCRWRGTDRGKRHPAHGVTFRPTPSQQPSYSAPSQRFLPHSPGRLCYDACAHAHTPRQQGRSCMDFYTILDQVVALLRQRQCVTYQALKRQFALDDEALADLTAELLYAHPQVRDDAGQGLLWMGDPAPAPAASAAAELPQQPP